MRNKTIYWVLTVFLAYLFSCAGSRPVQQPAKGDGSSFDYYYKALNFLESHQFDKALAELDTAIALKPEYAPFYYVQGRILQMVGKEDSAIVSYEKALRYKSYYPEVWKLLTPLYLKKGEFTRAVDIVKSLVGEYPDSLHYHLDLAEAYLGIGKPKLAIEEVRFFTSGHASVPRVNQLLGLAYFEAGEYTRAIPYLRKAVQHSPDNFQLQRALGIALFNQGKMDEGLSHLNRALQLRPDAAEIYLYRARYFWKRNKPVRAIEQLNLGIQRDSSAASLFTEKGKYLYLQGDTATARTLLEKALKLNPNYLEAYKWLGFLCQESGEPARARKLLLYYRQHTLHRDRDVEQRLKQLGEK